MLNPFARFEKNLGRAGLLLALAFLSSAALALALADQRVETDLPILMVYAAMPLVAWFVSRAAQAKGKNARLYGLASLLPPLAILLLLHLMSEDATAATNDPSQWP